MNDYKFSEFGNRIKTLREQKGIKQGQFADMIGITRQSMSNYESGKHSPDVDVIVKMAKHLNCTADYLLGMTEHSNLEKEKEFDETLIKFSEALYKIPEQLRIHWLDTFIRTAQGIGKDLSDDVQFHSLFITFYHSLTSLLECCSNAKEKKLQGNYSEYMTLKSHKEHFVLMQDLRNTLNNLDSIIFEYIDIPLENTPNNEAAPKLQEFQKSFEQHFKNKGDE